MKALLPYLDDHWRDAVEERGIPSLELISYPPGAPITARPDWRRQGGRAGTEHRRPAAPGARPLGRRPRDPQLPLRRAARVQRGHGGGVRPRRQRLDRQGMARPRSAPARLDRGAAAERRARGRRDRALGGRPPLRAGAGARHGRGAARPPPLLADLRRRRAPPACRSASMPAAPIAIRSPRSAGRATTSRTMRRSAKASSRRSRA